MSSRKRKIGDVAAKFYAVRAGHVPGVYSTWADCQKQITGFRGANFKSFPSREHAEMYAAGKDVSSPATLQGKNKGDKFYGVAVGTVPGVYETWPEAQEQIKGVKGPKYKKFSNRKEAEEFVKSGGKSKTAKEEPTQKEEYDDSDASAPSMKKVKTSSKLSTPTSSTHNGDGESKVKQLVVYTDGSSLGNGKNGAQAGVGVYFGDNDPRNVSEPLKGSPQTNQRAELTAILRALQICPQNVDMKIMTDSNYSINCCLVWHKSWKANGWKTSFGGDVLNKDLVMDIRALIDQRDAKGTETGFQWIKGHSNDYGNDAADKLAVGGAKAVIR